MTDNLIAFLEKKVAALEAENQRLREVVSKVNDRCDHLGMSLGEIKAERDALKADAARYAWIRSRRDLGMAATEEALDGIIDNAIRAAMEGQP